MSATDTPFLSQALPPATVSIEAPLLPDHVVTLHSTYPHANLGRLVRNLVASKARCAGPERARALREALLRAPTVRGAALTTEQWVRAFVLVTERQSKRISSAGVLHACLRLSEPDPRTTNVELAAKLRFEASHLASQARELGAAEPAARLFAAELLRRLSFDCKDVLIARRRPVSVTVDVERSGECPDYLAEALARGLHSESWRIASWRSAPLSL